MVNYAVGVILDSETVDCKITDVQIPRVPPDIDMNNWKSRDCGRNCWSHTPCIKIWVNLSATSQMLIQKSNNIL